ncbi:hypothetical protein NDU88_002091 [Pleurodeles waltl]|uniref:Uncharacterized protein n=1 Tax=Pleurodeles waltl TaxID=8319 RepID=A0AAV7KV58_PLEWA|nr:hypothetical protein NDU88_002091 [Pleurodeles waltl]
MELAPRMPLLGVGGARAPPPAPSCVALPCVYGAYTAPPLHVREAFAGTALYCSSIRWAPRYRQSLTEQKELSLSLRDSARRQSESHWRNPQVARGRMPRPVEG